MQKRTLLLYFIISILFAIKATGQSTCTEALLSAQRLYNEGIIEEIPDIIKPCLEGGFTRVESIEAYKLLILAYLFDDNQFEAENTILEFLKDNPDYELMPNDPIEFVYFYKTFKVLPKFSFGFAAGSNISNPHVIQSFTTGNPGLHNTSDKTGLGYNISLNFTSYIIENYGINAQLAIGTHNYTFIDKISDFTKTTVEENTTKFAIPLSVTREFPQEDFIPYVRAGLGGIFILTSEITPVREYLQMDVDPVDGAPIDILNHRRTFNMNLITGAGVKIPSGKGFLFIDLCYSYRFLNEINTDNRYNNQELWSKYYFVEDDFRLHNLEISAGYNFTLFKAIKN